MKMEREWIEDEAAGDEAAGDEAAGWRTKDDGGGLWGGDWG